MYCNRFKLNVKITLNRFKASLNAVKYIWINFWLFIRWYHEQQIYIGKPINMGKGGTFQLKMEGIVPTEKQDEISFERLFSSPSLIPLTANTESAIRYHDPYLKLSIFVGHAYFLHFTFSNNEFKSLSKWAVGPW